MPATATELNESRTGDAGSWTLLYRATGSSSDSDVISAVSSAAGLTYTVNGVVLVRDPNGPSIEEWVHVDGTKSEARVAVRYQRPDQVAPTASETDDDNLASFDWEQVGEASHITQSRSTISRTAPAGKTATNHKGAIGVSFSNGAIELAGVDIQVFNNRFVIKRYLSHEYCTVAYQEAVRDLAGSVNSGSFSVLFNGHTYNFDEGEVLFEGMNTSQRSGVGDIEATYHFAYSQNQSNIAVGDITVSSKKGWDYLWVEYERGTDGGGANKLVAKPAVAHVERVYPYASFSALDFPTAS